MAMRLVARRKGQFCMVWSALLAVPVPGVCRHPSGVWTQTAAPATPSTLTSVKAVC